ncbi:MAG TPA: hypothetical protein VG602_10235 [Actinomycetota bacterium]|nr:hypothetical protein [Actinomycetota bacterium]
MARRPSVRGVSNALLIALLAGVLATQAMQAVATHQPADKVAAASSNVRDIDGEEGNDLVVLRETVRVSSVADLVLSATSECALVTEVTTGNDESGEGDSDEASARASIDYYITIDGHPVPVSTVDLDPDPENEETDDGRIVFCDRLYTQEQTDDGDDNNDDLDELRTYMETRTANGFNWLALDVGKEYDEPEEDDPNTPEDESELNNIVTIELHAVFKESATTTESTADALVGRTSLIIEPTHVSVHEQVEPGTGV